MFADTDKELKMSTLRWTRWRVEQDARLTLRGDLTCADKVTLITNEDDGSLGLSLSQKQSELGGAVEAAPVSH